MRERELRYGTYLCAKKIVITIETPPYTVGAYTSVWARLVKHERSGFASLVCHRAVSVWQSIAHCLTKSARCDILKCVDIKSIVEIQSPLVKEYLWYND